MKASVFESFAFQKERGMMSINLFSGESSLNIIEIHKNNIHLFSQLDELRVFILLRISGFASLAIMRFNTIGFG